MAQLITKNPYSLVEINSYEMDDFENSKLKVQRLETAQKTWGHVDLSKRINLVKKGMEYFENHRVEIAKDISEQIGRPLHYCDGEVKGFFERADHLCAIARRSLAVEVIEPKEGFERSIEATPLGVVFVIAAWNYPLLIAVNSIIPALLAGNTVLLKHSKLTPEIGRHFEKAFGKLGEFGDLLFNVITDHETTGKIIENTGVNHVVFTGSVNGGRQILSHTSKRFMMPGLELGGKDAAYVHSDADLALAVEAVVDGALFNSGQSCCGIERAYVHEDVYEDFVNKAQKTMSSYKMGDPNDENVQLGPLAQPHAAEVMQNQVEEARSKGAKVVIGGEIHKIKKAVFFPATLVVNADNNMEIMREENFGPILSVMKVKSLQEGIENINDSNYGLTSAIFTKTKETAQNFANQVDTGTVFMNRCDYLDPTLPWTGVKDSGCGSSLSHFGFLHLTRRKSLHFKT